MGEKEKLAAEEVRLLAAWQDRQRVTADKDLVGQQPEVECRQPSSPCLSRRRAREPFTWHRPVYHQPESASPR